MSVARSRSDGNDRVMSCEQLCEQSGYRNPSGRRRRYSDAFFLAPWSDLHRSTGDARPGDCLAVYSSGDPLVSIARLFVKRKPYGRVMLRGRGSVTATGTSCILRNRVSRMAYGQRGGRGGRRCARDNKICSCIQFQIHPPHVHVCLSVWTCGRSMYIVHALYKITNESMRR